MWKAFLAGVGAIAVLVAGSVAVIVMVTGEDRPGPASGATARASRADAAGPAQARGNAPPPGPLTFGEAPAPAAAPPPVAGPPPPPPARDSWEAVPITARAKSLGRLGGLISARLAEIHDEVTTCFTHEAQARHGAAAVTTVKDAAPMDDTGSIVLVLQLEGQAGAIRIVDAPVETRGGAGDELLACAQSLLRGKVLDVPGAVAGKKYRLLYPLIP